MARVVTLGLTPGRPDIAYVRAPKKGQERQPVSSGPSSSYAQKRVKSRPTTSTVKDSRLQKTGHGIPSQSNDSCGKGLIKCKNCKRLVASSRMEAHNLVCSGGGEYAHKHPGSSSRAKKSSLLQSKPPPPSPRAEKEPPVDVSSLHLPIGRDRRFVICYVCGKEYTVHSIGIHIPQCIKKFYAENETLPIHQRRALPKKPEPPRELLEDNRPIGEGSGGDVDQAVQNYFEHCYTTFEDTLVPCRVCGRTFTADRHRVHEPKCKAKPIQKNS